MARNKGHGGKVATLFGSFDEVTNWGEFVSAEDCWIFTASDVVLEGSDRVSHDLGTSVADYVRSTKRRVPDKVDVAWFRRFAPVGLAITPSSVKKKTPILLGFVAGKLRKTQDGSNEGVAYPFLVRDSGDQILVEFSAAGPDLEVRRSILMTVAERLLWHY